jgi:hypothetical protein
MQTVDKQPLETIHLYVVREEKIKPSGRLPLILSVICFLVITGICLFSPNHPTYESKTIKVPAVFLPLEQFSVEQAIIPTGIKTYPPEEAHGTLTVYNGSILSERIPQGMIFATNQGIEIITDASVYIPSGNPPYYGVATIPSHAGVKGKRGNIPAFAIRNTFGTSLYIRNEYAFTGGANGYAVNVVTAHDRQNAMNTAKASLTAQVAARHVFLANPCYESAQEKKDILSVSWQCQFVTYAVAPYMRVTGVRLSGRNLFISVVFVARQRIIQYK